MVATHLEHAVGARPQAQGVPTARTTIRSALPTQSCLARVPARLPHGSTSTAPPHGPLRAEVHTLADGGDRVSDMAACARCNAPNADMYTPSGELVCRFCFNTQQNALADARAQASLAAEGVPGIKVAAPGAPPPSRGKLIGSGLAIIGAALVFAVATVVLLDRIYPIWVGLLLLGGIANVGRGLALRRS
jgi:hypothetical protein